MAREWLPAIWEFWNLSQILPKTWRRNEQSCLVVFQLNSYICWNLHKVLAGISILLSWWKKERDGVKCFFLLFWVERKEEKAADCTLAPASLVHQNQKSSVWLQMSPRWERYHTQDIVGRTGWKQNKTKQKIPKFRLVPNSGDFTPQRPHLPMQIW